MALLWFSWSGYQQSHQLHAQPRLKYFPTSTNRHSHIYAYISAWKREQSVNSYIVDTITLRPYPPSSVLHRPHLLFSRVDREITHERWENLNQLRRKGSTQNFHLIISTSTIGAPKGGQFSEVKAQDSHYPQKSVQSKKRNNWGSCLQNCHLSSHHMTATS